MAEDDEEWMRRMLARPGRDAELMAKGAGVMVYALVGWSTGTLREDAVSPALEFLTPRPEERAALFHSADPGYHRPPEGRAGALKEGDLRWTCENRWAAAPAWSVR